MANFNSCVTLLLQLYFTLSTLFLEGTHTLGAGLCPCKINIRTATADCHGFNLTKVPHCVPRSIKTLKLHLNLFKELDRGEFEEFKNLNMLDFAGNQIRRIKDGSFQGLEKLNKLSIAYNKLHQLNDSTFFGLSSLEELYLFNNKLRFLKDYSFKGLSTLTILDLHFNKLMYLGKYSFHGLYRLKSLLLSFNRLYFRSSLPQEIFRPLISLRYLNLEANCHGHKNCTYFDEQLREIPSLRSLHLSGLSYATLGPEFASLRRLQELHLGSVQYGDCYIEEISNKTFANLRSTPLSTLNLSNCDIVNASRYTFAYLKNLTTLDLTGNRLCDSLSFSEGMGTTSIKNLYLARSCRTSWTLYEHIFHFKYLKLEYLDISECYITSIFRKFWLSLPRTLTRLNLARNYLDYLLLGYLHTLENLLSLDLSHQWPLLNESPAGKVESISKTDKSRTVNLTRQHSRSELFSDVRSIETSTLSINKIHKTTDVLDSYQLLINMKDCFQLPIRLESLNISSSNLLLSVLPLFCNPNNSLKVLRAAGQWHPQNVNRLWKVMKNIPMLEELDLSNNFIKTLPARSVSHQKRLRLLWLSGNSLTTIDIDLKFSVQLKFIDLADNIIQYASKQFITDVESIAKYSKLQIRFQNNSLICNCNHMDTVAWLRYTDVILQKNAIHCTYLNGSLMSLARISEIDKALQAKCIALEVTLACIAGFSFLILLLSLITVAYYKRWNMKYLVYLGRRNVNPYHPLEESQIEFEYEVYISYERDSVIDGNKTLHDLVREHLYPQLIMRGFRVLVREELDIGMKLYDLISRALRKCENVIVLLSKDYCKDYWNVFEFNIAVLEGIYTKRSVVLPVIVDDVNPADLHEEIVTYLKAEPVPYFRSEQDASILIDYLCKKLR